LLPRENYFFEKESGIVCGENIDLSLESQGEFEEFLEF
jgi:hypothetical protein